MEKNLISKEDQIRWNSIHNILESEKSKLEHTLYSILKIRSISTCLCEHMCIQLCPTEWQFLSLGDRAWIITTAEGIDLIVFVERACSSDSVLHFCCHDTIVHCHIFSVFSFFIKILNFPKESMRTLLMYFIQNWKVIKSLLNFAYFIPCRNCYIEKYCKMAISLINSLLLQILMQICLHWRTYLIPWFSIGICTCRHMIWQQIHYPNTFPTFHWLSHFWTRAMNLGLFISFNWSIDS